MVVESIERVEGEERVNRDPASVCSGGNALV